MMGLCIYKETGNFLPRGIRSSFKSKSSKQVLDFEQQPVALQLAHTGFNSTSLQDAMSAGDLQA